ncbi:hypothetical protein B7463_g4290, partial [Scytalidium lignicola]
MPADYASTAKALSLPISPIPSPTPETQISRPGWTRNRSRSHRRGHSLSSQGPLSVKDRVLINAQKIQRRVISTFQRMSLVQRILAAIAGLIALTLGILFLVFNERIFGMLAPAAAKWGDLNGGWAILWAVTFFCAFPPIIGYSTAVMISGFVYGFPNGWFIVSTATVLGSTASFLASRTVLSKYVNRLVGEDRRFAAFALTLKHDGLKILCMIRVCPLPYSLSNAAMSTFPGVNPLMFALATAISTPKLLIHVFIGSRLRSIADAENGGKLDPTTRLINYASIAFGGILGAVVSWIIYSRTVARARELEIEELEAGRAEVGGSINGPRGSYSDDNLDSGEEDAAALMNDDDISLWETEEGYHDNFTDEEDVFAVGDGSEETTTSGGGKRVKL